MSRFLLPSCATIAALLPLSLAQPAKAGGENPGPVQSLALAVRLYDQASAQGDAVQMAAAAVLAAGIRIRRADWNPAPHPEGGKPAPEKAPGDAASAAAGPDAVTLDLLLSDAAWRGAVLMAEEDEILSDFLAAPGTRQNTGGVSRADSSLAPGKAEVWTIPFNGQSPAEVSVFIAAESSGQPLWRLEDQSGAVLCPPQDRSWPACRFTPEANGFFRVIVENTAQHRLAYSLISN